MLAAGVRRLLVVSSMGADDFDAESDDTFQVYLRAKSEGDAAVRERDLDWTMRYSVDEMVRTGWEARQAARP